MKWFSHNRLLAKILGTISLCLVLFVFSAWFVMGRFNQIQLEKRTGKYMQDSLTRLREGLVHSIWYFDLVTNLNLMTQEMSNPAIKAIILKYWKIQGLSEDSVGFQGVMRMENGRLQYLDDESFRAMDGMAMERLIPKRYSKVDSTEIWSEHAMLGKVDIYIDTRVWKKEATDSQNLVLAQLIALSAILFIVLVFAMRRTVLSPLGSLTAAVRKAREGERVSVPTAKLKDEIGELSRAFRSMNETIANYNERLEQLVSERTYQLEETQKGLAYGSLMAAEIAHDIKTPLGSCLTAVTYLKEEWKTLMADFEENRLGKQALKEFLDNAGEGMNILETNLDVAINLSVSFKDVVTDQLKSETRLFELGPYLGNVVLSMKPRLRKHGVSVDLKCDPSWKIKNDPGALSQVFINLITNSIVHAFPAPESVQAVITIDVTKEAETFIIVYRDNGKGMTPFVLSHLFEPMFTTKKDQGGTGLGLAIIKDLAEKRMGGTITAWSEEGKGTAFTIRLPE